MAIAFLGLANRRLIRHGSESPLALREATFYAHRRIAYDVARSHPGLAIHPPPLVAIKSRENGMEKKMR